jgi:hypothetical protein
MSVNVSVYDLETYPDNNKTVTVDIKQVTPIGYEGDEQWVLSVTTTAYSQDFIDNNGTTRLSISDVYILDQKAGWAKSSGLISANKFDFTGSDNQIKVKIDGDTSWRTVTLATGSGISADTVAARLETGIRAYGAPGAAMSGDLGYLNASVEYEDGYFKIVSGSVDSSYSDTVVKVDATSTAATKLGFDLGIDTALLSLAAYEPKETTVASTYTSPAASLVMTDSLSWSAGDAFAITAGGNSPAYEYFVVVSGTGSTVFVRSDAGDFLSGSYSVGDKIQKLRYQDPKAVPTPWYQDIDTIVRWGVKTQANQIDFSQ